MSFFSDLFHGNFSNLGHDLNPSNVFNDFGTDAKNVLSNPLDDAAIAAAIALPFLAPEIGAGLGAIGTGVGDALGVGGSAAADTASLGAASAAGAAAGGAPLDLTALTGAADASLPANATLDSLATGTGGFAIPGSPAALVNSDFATIGSGVDASGGAIAGAGAPLNLASAAGTTGGVATGAGGAATGAGGAGAGTFLSNAASGNIWNALTAGGADLKAVSPVIGAGGLGYNIYQGVQTNQANKALQAQEATTAANAANLATTEQGAAQPLLNSGQTLMTYLQTGTLPQAFQQSLDRQIAAAKAQIIQGYATRNMSTNPSQNSALAQDLANVDAQAQNTKAQLETTLSTAGNQMVTTANSLLTSGLNATEFAAELPIKIATLNTQLNQAMSSSISNFAAAINGGGIRPNTPQNVINPSGGLTI